MKISNVPNTRYLEFIANHYKIWNQWISPPIVHKEGMLGLPTAPGLGVELSEEVMERGRKR